MRQDNGCDFGSLLSRTEVLVEPALSILRKAGWYTVPEFEVLGGSWDWLRVIDRRCYVRLWHGSWVSRPRFLWALFFGPLSPKRGWTLHHFGDTLDDWPLSGTLAVPSRQVHGRLHVLQGNVSGRRNLPLALE